MLPFTRGEFFAVFADYNIATWPVAVLAYPIAIAAIACAWRGTSSGSRAAGLLLGLMWAWVGIAYHGHFFSRINAAAIGFAAAFALQAGLLAAAAASGSLRFGSQKPLPTAIGAILILYAMVAYPLIGLLAGEGYPSLPLFGVAPCPLLIFTFGLLVWATTAKWWLWPVPLLWSVIGGSAAILLSVPQDWALPVSAATAVAIRLPGSGRAARPARLKQ